MVRTDAEQPVGFAFEVAVADVGGQRGELVDHQHHRRIRRRWDVGAGVAEHRPTAAVHQHAQVLQQLDRLFLGGRDLGEEFLADAEFDAVLQIHRIDAHRAGGDGGCEAGDDAPDQRSLAGTGAAGDQRVPSRQAELPVLTGLQPTHPHRPRDRIAVSGSGRTASAMSARASRMTRSNRTTPGDGIVHRTECALAASRSAGAASSRWSTVWPHRTPDHHGQHRARAAGL